MKGVFGRVSKSVPAPAALSNRLFGTSFAGETGYEAIFGFHWHGEAPKSWLHQLHGRLPPRWKQSRNRGAVLPNIFQNGSNSTREAAPQEESEPELFLKEPKPYHTGPNFITHALL